MSGVKVLSVASEVFPLIKTGGLADVVGALPAALARENVEIRTLVPGYPAVMTKLAPLGITRLEGIHYYVRDLERSRSFYTGKLDFAETWRSSPELEQTGKQRLV